MTLSLLLNDTAALLNDQNFSFTSQNQLTRWINDARRQVAYRTGCVRRLISGQSAFGASAQPNFFIPGAAQPGALPGAFPQTPGGPPLQGGTFVNGAFVAPSDFNDDFNNDFGGTLVPANGTLGVAGAVQNGCRTIPGVERYPYVGFFNPFLKRAYPGCESVLDTIALAVNWGGVSRPALDWRSWDDFQAYCRAYAVLNTSYPSVWSVYNDGPQGEIWMFPIPSTYGEIELDAFCEPSDIYKDSDPEVIPRGFYNAIKFGAASLAFMTSQRYAQAQVMEERFADRLGVARVTVDRGKNPSYYDTRF